MLHPEQRNYWVQRSTLTEAGIASRWNMDLFVALREDLGRRALEHARADAAAHRLRLARGRAHGARRRAGGDRSPLSRTQPTAS